MSATKPATRSELKEYCLRRLGKPVIQINVADSQVEDLVDEALEFFHRNHYDGTELVYLPVTADATAKTNKYFPISDSIISVTEVLQSTVYGTSMFSIEWQMMASATQFALQGDGLLTYSMAMEYREMLKSVISGKTKHLRFNRHTNKLYIDMDWSSVAEGQMFFVEGYMAVDPTTNTDVWNDPFLKEYLEALIKRQWGNNLRKLRNVQLVGGVTIDGDVILQEAEAQITSLKERMTLEFQEPVDFTMG